MESELNLGTKTRIEDATVLFSIIHSFFSNNNLDNMLRVREDYERVRGSASPLSVQFHRT